MQPFWETVSGFFDAPPLLQDFVNQDSASSELSLSKVDQ